MVIIYDFDGTLTPYAMPKYKILEDNSYDENKLLKEAQKIIETNNISIYEAIYIIITRLCKKTKYTKEKFISESKNVEFNLGVIEYFKYVNKLSIKNYIVTSGIEDFVKNTKISKYVDGVYGTRLNVKDDIYNNISFLLDDKAKTEVIKKIIDDNPNDKYIYIGDGLTDKIAFEYIKQNGGIAIFVGDSDNESNEYKSLANKGIVDYYFKRDFCDGSNLRNYIENWQ